jgi:hypothetical protein
MRLVVFARQDSPLNQQLGRTLADLTPGWEIVFCPTQGELAAALERPDHRQATVLLVATEDRQPESLDWLGQLRHKLKLVLILPNHDPWNVHDGHALQPRFIAYADDDLRELIQVLEHIKQRESPWSTPFAKETAIVKANP